MGRKGCITGLWHSYATYSTESSQEKKDFFYKPNTKDTQSHAQEFDAFYRCSLVYKKADVAVKGREAEYFLAI